MSYLFWNGVNAVHRFFLKTLRLAVSALKEINPEFTILTVGSSRTYVCVYRRGRLRARVAGFGFGCVSLSSSDLASV